jgi:hypothetical protein
MKPTDNGRTKFNTDVEQGREKSVKGAVPGAQGLNTATNEQLRDMQDDASSKMHKEASQTGGDAPTKTSNQGVEQNAPRKGSEEGTFHKGGPDKS